MARYPSVQAPRQSRVVTDRFFGLNEGEKCGEGEFEASGNLTSEEFPLLAVRARRGLVESGARTGGMLRKGALAQIRGRTLWYGGKATMLDSLTEPRITEATAAPEDPDQGDFWFDPAVRLCRRYEGGAWLECEYPQKQLVSMGAYLCVFPDGAYFNTRDPADWGYMAAEYRSGSGSVRYELCLEDGSAAPAPVCSDTPPTDPENGALWIDTSGTALSLHQYSAAQGSWVGIATACTKILFSTQNEIGAFSAGDGVTLSGAAGSEDAAGLNGAHVLREVGCREGQGDYVVITGLIRAPFLQSEGEVVLRREVPPMDYVCEAQNRLWGCRYGFDGEKNVNELYCCALGDFKNWNRFQGISTDSWAASVGTDGPWTGCVNYLGHPTFFKEDRIHRIAVSPTGAHRVSDVPCRGVGKGSSRSLAMADEVLFYHARDGVCAYDGAQPVLISEKLRRRFSQASGGTLGSRYYLSGYSGGAWHLMTYDAVRRIWWEEDDTCALSFASGDGDLLLEDDGGRLWSLSGAQGALEEEVAWFARTGRMDYGAPDQKTVSRYDVRAALPEGGSLRLEIEYDSSGVWEDEGEIVTAGTGSFVFPVRPRRCDHLRLRLSGRGEARICSVARILEVGSDVV